MGFLSRLRATVDPWGARAAWLNKNMPGLDMDRARAKQFTMSARAWSEGRGGGIPRDRYGRPIGLINQGPRNTMMADGAVMRREGELLSTKNNQVKNTIRQIVTSVVGNGANIKPSTRLKTEKAKLTLTTAFNRSFEETTELDNRRRMNFHGLSRFWLKNRLERGGVIIRIRPRKRRDPLAVPIALQTLTYDYLYDGPAPAVGNGANDLREGEDFACGIAFDQLGEETAFFLYKRHPDDTTAGHGLSNVTRVEKYARDGTEQVIHWFEPGHNDDPIGTPRACSIFGIASRKMDYELSVVDRKRIESKRIGVWEADHSANPDDLPGRNTPTEWVDEDGEIHVGPAPGYGREPPLSWSDMQDWVNSMGGSAVADGETLTAPPGYKFKHYETANFNDHPQFSEGMAREMAAGMMTPEWLSTGDLRKLSFAGGELGLLYWQQDCKAEFDDFAVKVIRPIWRAWVMAGERAGLWNAKDIGVTIRQNRPPKRDLLKDIKTLAVGMEKLVIAREDAITELGQDTIEEVNEKILRDLEWRRANGIAFPQVDATQLLTGSPSAQASELTDAVAEAIVEASRQAEQP